MGALGRALSWEEGNGTLYDVWELCIMVGSFIIGKVMGTLYNV